MYKNLRIGLFGFGCVGQGLFEVLSQSKGIQAQIVKICIKNPLKKRPINPNLFTTDANSLLYDQTINVIIELIDDAEVAFEIVSKAMQNGKSVISANKKMIAEHLEELIELQNLHKVSFLYEGSCGASIPILRNLEEYYDNDMLTSVEGVLNGSTNYILDKIFTENINFENALKQAQENGFAESNPLLDINAIDPKYKLCILLLHAFGLIINPTEIYNYGISTLTAFDFNFAKEKGYRIKLIAKCTKKDNSVTAYCIPKFISITNNLSYVNLEYNGIILETGFSQTQFFLGKGAGSKPTGSAVLSDLSALKYGYKYEYKKRIQGSSNEFSSDENLLLYLRCTTQKANVYQSMFNTIHKTYTENEISYIIGEVNLQNLKKSNVYSDTNATIISF